MKHTKGNWIHQTYPGGDIGIYSDEGNANDIALVRNSHKEAEANVKLISAAPDLLEACMVVQEMYSDLKDQIDNETYSMVYKIEQAIKKATE